MNFEKSFLKRCLQLFEVSWSLKQLHKPGSIIYHFNSLNFNFIYHFNTLNFNFIFLTYECISKQSCHDQKGVYENYQNLKLWNLKLIITLFETDLTLLGRGGTIFKPPFLQEKRVLEVQNFVTFPNSIWTFRKSKKNFLVFHSVLRWSRRCRLIQLPPRALKQHPGAPLY